MSESDSDKHEIEATTVEGSKKDNKKKKDKAAGRKKTKEKKDKASSGETVEDEADTNGQKDTT